MLSVEPDDETRPLETPAFTARSSQFSAPAGNCRGDGIGRGWAVGSIDWWVRRWIGGMRRVDEDVDCSGRRSCGRGGGRARRGSAGFAPQPPAKELPRRNHPAERPKRVPCRSILTPSRMYQGPRAEGRRSDHRLGGNHGEPRWQECLRRLLIEQCDRGVQAQSTHRDACPGLRDLRVHRRRGR